MTGGKSLRYDTVVRHRLLEDLDTLIQNNGEISRNYRCFLIKSVFMEIIFHVQNSI